MIQYALICENQHKFDGWFKGTTAYDVQQVRGAVVCPVCGSSQVSKAIMAPAIARSDKTGGVRPVDPAQLHAALRALRDKVVSEAENVGSHFAEEARKIHYKDAPERGIYGQASRDEVIDLVEEGIEFMPLPALPDDLN